MFDKINHSASQNVDVPANNRLKCKYCKSDMLQISGSWDSFCCIKCGGRCIIHADQKTIWSKSSSGLGFTIISPYKIVWDKIEVIDKAVKTK